MRLTDAGLETVLVFEEGFELPQFAAFPLVDSEEGRAALRRYYGAFLELARDRDVPLVLSPSAIAIRSPPVGPSAPRAVASARASASRC